MRFKRKGRPYGLRPLYLLKKSRFDALRNGRTLYVVADLSGINFSTFRCYYYRGIAAPKEKAEAVAMAFSVPLERLWDLKLRT